jgi:hypothetical protein
VSHENGKRCVGADPVLLLEQNERELTINSLPRLVFLMLNLRNELQSFQSSRHTSRLDDAPQIIEYNAQRHSLSFDIVKKKGGGGGGGGNLER